MQGVQGSARLCFLALLLATNPLVFATQPPPLTLGECVRRALERGFDMEIGSHELQIARDRLVDAQSAFDPLISASAAQSVLRSAANAVSPVTRSDSLITNLGVSQRLHFGTNVELSTGLGRSDVAPATEAMNPAYASDVTLSLRQPLLKGFGRTVNMAGIRSAEISLASAGHTYRGLAMDVILAVENSYYALAGARERLEVFRSSLELARKLLEEAQARKAAGMATKLDVLQAEVGVANARRAVLEAENTVKTSEEALLALIGRFELDRPLGPTVIDDDVVEPLPDVDSSYALALQHQPELAAARAALELARLDEALAEDDLKPFLDLDVAVGLRGREDSGRGAYSGAFAGDNSSWQAGLTLIYPLGRVGEKARYRQSRAAVRRQVLRIQQLEQDILVDVRSAVRDVRMAHEGVQIAALAVRLSEEQYEAERARFRGGLSTSRRVLEAQTDLESARVAELEQRLALRTALARLRRIEGRSLEYYGIELPIPAE